MIHTLASMAAAELCAFGAPTTVGELPGLL